MCSQKVTQQSHTDVPNKVLADGQQASTSQMWVSEASDDSRPLPLRHYRWHCIDQKQALPNCRCVSKINIVIILNHWSFLTTCNKATVTGKASQIALSHLFSKPVAKHQFWPPSPLTSTIWTDSQWVYLNPVPFLLYFILHVPPRGVLQNTNHTLLKIQNYSLIMFSSVMCGFLLSSPHFPCLP